MTPTYLGRVQTRLLLTLTVVLPIGILFGLALSDLKTPLLLVLLTLIIGLCMDIVYSLSQYRSWDDDWPTLLMVLAGLIEGLLLWLIVHVAALLPVDFLHTIVVSDNILLRMYGSTWLTSFIVQLGILNVFFPYQRFAGGKIWRF